MDLFIKESVGQNHSSFETGFISTAITDEMIEETVKAAYETLKEITA
ncbi:hypothetical protein [Sulfurovum sp.]|nr:hypothetical protein [Sulfurovum sp.]